MEDLNDGVLELVQQEGPMRARDLIFVLLVSQPALAFGEVMHELTMKADMLGRLEGAEHRPDTVELASDMGTPSFVGLPFTEAKDFFQKKQIMSPGEFRALDDRYKARGFTIAGVKNRKVLEDAHGALSAAISDGVSERDTMKRLRQAFVDGGEAWPGDFHMQTVFDQNILGAYAAGRYAQLTDAHVLKTRPFWQYRTAGDSRVRPAHRAMDKRIFPADSEVWQRWFPPNGFRCRCGVVSLSQGDVDAGKLTVGDKLPDRAEVDGQFTWLRPDPGFSGSPATQAAVDHKNAVLHEDAHASRALQDTPDGLNRIKKGEGEREARDEHRRKEADQMTGLSPAEVRAELEESFCVNAYPRVDELPAAGEAFVDWHSYSQNLFAQDQMVARVVQEDGLYGLRDRMSIVPKATYMRRWEPAAWPDPEVVYDDALARELGLDPAPPATTTARSTEYALRMRVRAGELPRLLELLEAAGQKQAGAVRKAWKVQDVRIATGEGMPSAADGDKWVEVWRNSRVRPDGTEIVTLSRERLKGWTARLIVVNRSLYEVLG